MVKVWHIHQSSLLLLFTTYGKWRVVSREMVWSFAVSKLHGKLSVHYYVHRHQVSAAIIVSICGTSVWLAVTARGTAHKTHYGQHTDNTLFAQPCLLFTIFTIFTIFYLLSLIVSLPLKGLQGCTFIDRFNLLNNVCKVNIKFVHLSSKFEFT